MVNIMSIMVFIIKISFVFWGLLQLWRFVQTSIRYRCIATWNLHKLPLHWRNSVFEVTGCHSAYTAESLLLVALLNCSTCPPSVKELDRVDSCNPRWQLLAMGLYTLMGIRSLVLCCHAVLFGPMGRACRAPWQRWSHSSSLSCLSLF